MSLLGNRGRFSSGDELNIKSFNNDLQSKLALIGKNPRSVVNLPIKDDSQKETIKDKIIKEDLTEYHSKVDSKHEAYNNRLDSFNSKKEKSYSKKDDKSENSFSKRRISIFTIIAMILIEGITIAGILFYAQVHRLTKIVQDVPFNPEVVQNTEIDANTINIMKGYKTVAIFGVDSRNGSIAEGNNADVNILVNLNVENGDVELISLYRDLYLSVTDNNTYDKLNSAYSRGGPEGAVKAINKNFDLNITNFFAFNWKAVADGIFLLGGIDIDITRAEYKYMNAFIHETCIATGIDAKNPASHYIKSAGMQHLDGIQAVAYGRLRLMDSDFKRVERQKAVIVECLKKAKSMDLNTLRAILETVLPQIAYEFDLQEMISLLRIVRNVNIVESTGCPDISNVVSMEMGAAGSCVVPLNLEKAVVKLHKTLFNEDDYEVSPSVRRYSNRITELRHKFQEENDEKESIKQSIELESLAGNIAPQSRPNVSSSSNAVPTNRLSSRSTAIRATAPIANNTNVVDVTVYEDEPEEDTNKTSDGNANASANTNVNTNTNANINTNINSVPINNNSSNTGAGEVVEGPPGFAAPVENTTEQNNQNQVVEMAPGGTPTSVSAGGSDNSVSSAGAPGAPGAGGVPVSNSAPIPADTIIEPQIVIP